MPTVRARGAAVTVVTGLLTGVLAAVLTGVLGLSAPPTARAVDPDRSDPMPWGVGDRLPSPIEDQSDLVRDIAFAHGTAYVVGYFRTVDPVAGGVPESQPFAAAFDELTGAWLSDWRPQLNGPALEVEVAPDGDTVIVGGEFTSVAGNTRAAGLAFLDARTGAPIPRSATTVEWARTQGSMVVDALAVSGSELYLGGNFSHLHTRASGRVAVSRLARLDLETRRIDASWRPRVTGGRVATIGIDRRRGRAYVGGPFTEVNGDAGAQQFAALRLGSGSLFGALPQGLRTANQPYRSSDCRPRTPACRKKYTRPGHYPFDIEVFPGHVAVVGDMMVEVMRASDLASVASWSRRTAWRRGTCPLDGDAMSLEYFDGWLYIGGHFDQLHIAPGWGACNTGKPQTLMRWARGTGFDQDFGFSWGSQTPAVWALTGDTGQDVLWAGGRFTQSGGTPTLHLAKFTPGGAVPVDTERPSTPSRLRVAEVTPSSVTLTWEASTDNVGVAGYRVYRSTTAEVLGPLVGTATDVRFVDTTVQSGTTYYYALRAFDAAGNISWRTGFQSATPG